MAKDRQTELEIQLLHQQRLVEQLNEVVSQQTQDLIRLRTQVSKLQKQLEGLTQWRNEQSSAPANEKPPHY